MPYALEFPATLETDLQVLWEEHNLISEFVFFGCLVRIPHIYQMIPIIWIVQEEIYRVHLNIQKHCLHLVVSIIYVNSFGAICLSGPNGPMARYEVQRKVVTYQPCLNPVWSVWMSREELLRLFLQELMSIIYNQCWDLKLVYMNRSLIYLFLSGYNWYSGLFFFLLEGSNFLLA